MVVHYGTILLCGGWNNEQNCLQLEEGTWKVHSKLDKWRYGNSAVKTQSATFVFGGINSDTYEYLLKDSSTWLMGKTNIPGGFRYGCAIAVKSEQEILLIGGKWTEMRILSFNVNSHTFQILSSQLNLGRYEQRCAFIPKTNKIMITGGQSNIHDFILATEILDTEDGSVTMASCINSKRSSHGMGVLTINGEDKLAITGGCIGENKEIKRIELYNNITQEWEFTDSKSNETNYEFGFLIVKLSDIIPKL